MAIKCRDIFVLACYISPNVPLGEFLDFLDEMSEVSGRKVIICGDFNSKSTL